jgi:hypothetical protein
MNADEQRDAVEACGRMIAFEEPMPRVFDSLVDQVIEARGGWEGGKPVNGVIDTVFDEIFAVANAHRARLYVSAMSHALRPVVRH